MNIGFLPVFFFFFFTKHVHRGVWHPLNFGDPFLLEDAFVFKSLYSQAGCALKAENMETGY